mmetsp:Transcript_15535/g.32070  ORF Transcript_15535/g.32070 Transcript_15535/m.32070 type:complete len:351 (-) Transcript_15535:2780-3832(-)
MKFLGVCCTRQCKILAILSTLFMAFAGAFHTEYVLRHPKVSASRPEKVIQSTTGIRPPALSNGTGDTLKSLENLSLRAGGDNDSLDKRTNIVSEIIQYCNKNYFLVGMVVAVSMAKAFPALGKNGGILRPEVSIGNYGVALIFLLSGFSLQTSDLAKAISNFKLNGLVNLLLFGFWPFCIGLPLRYIFTDVFPNLIPSALADGLLITTTLPTTVNMCIMLTSTAGGNAASAICNAFISNLAGIILTPLLLLKFFGATIELPFGQMVLKLCKKSTVAGHYRSTSQDERASQELLQDAFKEIQAPSGNNIVGNSMECLLQCVFRWLRHTVQAFIGSISTSTDFAFGNSCSLF